MNKYPDCYFCGGGVVEKTIEHDYRRAGKHLIFQNVPAGVCQQCHEKFFRPEVLKQMDTLYSQNLPPTEYAKIPVIQFKTA